MRVADFFSGAGGFSEGFRMAGCEIVFALDNWNDARQTHKLNHPNCKHPGLDCHFETKGDILLIDIERIDKIIDDTEIIIGSPPCVSFSSSNKAGNADKTLGIALIEKYLQIIAIKKHKKGSILKHWLMENVPNSINHVKEKYSFSDLGIEERILKKYGIKKSVNDIALDIDKENKIFNSVYYGVPQKRKRFVCGEFILPRKSTESEEKWIKLGTVIDSLKENGDSIIDPLYGFEISSNELTDHHYNTIIPQFEWEEAMMKKQQARYYGKMSFPENPNQPSRTIMATRSILAREAMILPNGSPGNFRAPTIREVASLMSFPITYLFQAENEASKYRLVGNAVCPLLAFSFAKKIMDGTNKKIIKPIIKKADYTKLIVDLKKIPPPKKMARDKDPKANFAEIVPDLKTNNFRVELDNNLPRDSKKKIIWSASIHHATGKESMKFAKVNSKKISDFFSQITERRKIKDFMNDLEKSLKSKIPNANKFQEQHYRAEHDKQYMTPRESMKLVKQLVDKHFNETDYSNLFFVNINKSNKRPILNFNKGSIPNNKIPSRIVFAAYGMSRVAELTKK